MGQLEERNKAVVLRLKDEVSSQGRFEVMKEIAGPGFRPHRQGLHNLVQNARDQGFPEPGQQMRAAVPDRVDHIEAIVAEGDRVGMLWRMTGTHGGNLCGIPATGRRFEVFSAGWFRVENGLIAEATFMADEASLLKQIGQPLPRRKDGGHFVPPITGKGEDPRKLLEALKAKPSPTRQDLNKIVALRSKLEPQSLGALRASDYRHRRSGLQHFQDHAKARGTSHLNPGVAFPDRVDRIDGLIAEGDLVWMQFRLTGTQQGSLFGHPPSGRPVEVAESSVLKIVDGRIVEGLYFGDELGLALQVGATDLLFAH